MQEARIPFPTVPGSEEAGVASGGKVLLLGLLGLNGLKFVPDPLYGVIVLPVAVPQLRKEIPQFVEIPGHFSLLA